MEESPFCFTLSTTSEILISRNLAFSCGILAKIGHKPENVLKSMLTELKLLKLSLQNPCRKGCTFRSGGGLADEMYAYSNTSTTFRINFKSNSTAPCTGHPAGLVAAPSWGLSAPQKGSWKCRKVQRQQLSLLVSRVPKGVTVLCSLLLVALGPLVMA